LQQLFYDAYFLITEEGKSASEIFVDLGFKYLSHFSYTFKKQFDYN